MTTNAFGTLPPDARTAITSRIVAVFTGRDPREVSGHEITAACEDLIRAHGRDASTYAVAAALAAATGTRPEDHAPALTLADRDQITARVRDALAHGDISADQMDALIHEIAARHGFDGVATVMAETNLIHAERAG